MLQLQIYMQLQLLHYNTQHYTTLRYTNYITLRYIYSCNCTCNCHYVALRYTTLIPTHYNYNCITLHYTRLQHTVPHCSTLQYTTRYYANYTTPQLQLQLQLQLHYTNYITLGLQLTTTTRLHYTTTTTATATALHHTTSNGCGDTTAATIAASPENTSPTSFPSISGCALPSVIHNMQPTSPVGFLFSKLPPPPCAVLLVNR